jgi:hypothetical protein
MTTHLKHGRRVPRQSRARCRKAYLDRLQGISAPSVADLATALRCDPSTVRHWMQRDDVGLPPGPRPGGRHRPLTTVQMERVRHYRALGASVAVILRAVAADLPDSPVTRHQVLRLKREDNWPDLRPSQAPPRRQSKPFDPPPPGYIHCDTIIGPTADCPVIFTARERASGMCWAQASREKTSAQAAHFLTHVVASCPLQIHTVLTDNGSEFRKDFVARATALGLVHRHGFVSFSGCAIARQRFWDD